MTKKPLLIVEKVRMPSRIIKFLIVALIVFLVSYLFYLNPGSATVSFSPGSSLKAPMAVILLVTFFAGASVVGLVAVVFGIRSAYQSWKKEHWLKKLDQHRAVLLKGKELLAVGDFTGAQSVFKKIVQQNPGNVLAWSFLSECYEQQHNMLAASEILDQARLTNSDSLEILLRAARVQSSLGNHTAAYDNLSLVLKQQPNSVYALRSITQSAEAIGKLDEALRFQTELIKRLPSEQQEREYNKLALLRLRKAEQEHGDNYKLYKSALEDILRKHRDFTPAAAELGELEKNADRYGDASRHWARAFQLSGSTSYLEQIATLWLEREDPEKAISYVRNAVRALEAPDPKALRGQLFLASVYYYVGMVQQAADEIRFLEPYSPLPEDLQLPRDVLLAQVESKRGDGLQSSRLVYAAASREGVLFAGKALRNGSSRFASGPLGIAYENQDAPPSPQLSTP